MNTKKRTATSRLVGYWLDHDKVSTEMVRLGRPRDDLFAPCLPGDLIEITLPFLQRMKPQHRQEVLGLDPRWADAWARLGGIRVASHPEIVRPGASVEAVPAP